MFGIIMVILIADNFWGFGQAWRDTDRIKKHEAQFQWFFFLSLLCTLGQPFTSSTSDTFLSVIDPFIITKLQYLYVFRLL